MKNQICRRVDSICIFGFVSFCLVVGLGYESRAADRFIENSRIFYTINPTKFGNSGSPFSLDQIASNPMVEVNPSTGTPDPASKEAYINAVFEKIIKNCHASMAKIGTLDTEDVGFYWAQVVGCLVVPYHESKLTHFRKLSDIVNASGESICSLRMNNGQFLSGNSTLFDLFLKTFKAKEVVKECSLNKAGQEYIQLVGSSDAYSTGIMQIAMNWHGPHVMAGGHFNVDETLKYGLEKYLKSMNQLRNKISQYSCLKTNGETDYINLVRSPWSGDYNAGNISKSCRYTIPNDPWAKNDLGFMADLKNVLGNVSLYSEGLSGNELKAFQMIQSSMLYYFNRKSPLPPEITAALKTNRETLMDYVSSLNP